MDIADQRGTVVPANLTQSRSSRLPRIADLCAKVLVALAIIRFWIMPLGSSFWVDELGGLWAVQGGPGSFLSRYAEFPSNPPLYALISWIAYTAGGAHEYVLRLPSVLAMALTCLLLYSLAGRLFGRDAAFPAVAVFVGLEPIAFAAADARPYAFLLLVIVGSTLALVRWLDGGLKRHAIAYVLSAALIPYLHYLAMPVLLIHLAYASARIRKPGPVLAKHLALAGVLAVCLMAPAVPPLLHLLQARQEHVFMPSPRLRSLAKVLLQPMVLLGVAAGLAVARLACGKIGWRGRDVRPSALALPLAMAMAPAVLAFVISITTETRIFVPRYVIASFAGISLIAGWAIGAIRPVSARLIAVSAVVIVSLGTTGDTDHFWPTHGKQGWRGAIQAVNRVAGTTQIPVLMRNLFPETAPDRLRGKSVLPAWALAPLLLYPARGNVMHVSKVPNPESDPYLQGSLGPLLDREGRFIVLGVYVTDSVREWLPSRFAGYSACSLGDFGDVSATLYERGGK